MNAVTEMNHNTAVAVHGEYDPFAAYGQEAASGGTFLKFSKGEWLLGQGNDEVELGRLLVANMGELAIGWIRWEAGKPAERRMNLLVSGVRPELRQNLGFTDQTMWEVDDETGQPIDPWNFTNELPLADPETGEQMTFSASSKGGIGCIGNLCKSYASSRGQHPGLVPVLELARDSYMHPKYKKTYVPVLNIVDWVENGSVPQPAHASETTAPITGSANITEAPDTVTATMTVKDPETPATDKAAGAKTRF